MAQGSGRP